MNNELEILNNEKQEMPLQNNELANAYAENLKEAETAGNKNMAEYYRKKGAQIESTKQKTEKSEFKVEDKLNPENKEDEFGACAGFCRQTVTNSQTGGAVSYHY